MKRPNKIDLKKIFPLNPDFLFIDRVVSYDPKKKIVAKKYLTGKEWFFQGHFPNHPVMPGSLITEAMVQTGALFFKKLKQNNKDKIFYLVSSKVRFLKSIKPKDTLTVIAQPVKIFSKAGIFKAEARIRNKLVAKGEFTAAIKL